MGFRQTKPTFVIRPGDIVTPFFHFHKFSFGPYFRIYLGVRVMNDTFVALALNGPSHGHAVQYSESDEDIRHCVQVMATYCRAQGLPWLERWSDPKELLAAKDTPLHPEEREALSDAIARRFNIQAIALSESLLGLRSGQNTAT